MKHEHINAVRIDRKTSRSILMTRFGTRTDHPLRTVPGPLTEKMKDGQVWRIRWRSAELGLKGLIILIDAQPIPSALV
jgi:hypothetical protein